VVGSTGRSRPSLGAAESGLSAVASDIAPGPRWRGRVRLRPQIGVPRSTVAELITLRIPRHAEYDERVQTSGLPQS
jgi:hypothetical protein